MSYSSILDIKEILNDYSKEVEDDMFEVAKQVAEESVEMIKAESPVNEKDTKRKGRYKRGWRMELTKGFGTISATTYNKTDYQLTHLLERPHVGKNQYGVWGTVYPKSEGHISKVQEEANKLFEEKITKKLGG